MDEKNPTIIYGIHPVQEALRASRRRCRKIVIQQGKTHSRIHSLVQLANQSKVKVETLPKPVFQKKFKSISHQGVIGYFAAKEPLELKELIRQAYLATPRPALAILDGIQDPQNLGAIIRSAEVFGIQGLILPKRRAAPITETVSKCSAGAIETLYFSWVTNLSQAIDQLKKEKFWIVGIDPQGEKLCCDFKFDVPVALIIGGEAKGIRPNLKKNCDFTLSIPMEGAVDSLNASAAGAVIFYEILRQKKTARK